MTSSQFKSVRARLGITQSALAEKLGVSVKAVQSWEQGWRTVPGPVERLMEIFEKYAVKSVVKRRHKAEQ